MALSKLTVDRGTTYVISGSYQDSDGNTNITGAAIRFTVKEDKWDTDTTDTSALITKAGTITNAAGGLYKISLADTDTDIDAGKFYYDIKIELADGTIYRLDFGHFIVDGSPTNRTS